jgi:hypothetical protein
MTGHHPLKKGELLLRAPGLELLVRKEATDLDQVFNGLLLHFGLGFRHFEIFGPDGFHPYGGIGEEFPEFEPFGNELSPEELGLLEIGLLKKVKTLCLLRREIELGCSPAPGVFPPGSCLREGKIRKEEDEKKREDNYSVTL